MPASSPTPIIRPRKCENWLHSFADYVEETEAPRHFWLWSGISTIAGALQRKVWLPFGMEPVYPCLYIMIVAPPGECRKGAPISLSKRLLSEAKVGLFADSPTKRALTKHLAELAQRQGFSYVDPVTGKKRFQQHASISLLSKELSSFLAVDAKAMIEILTEIYDPHDDWEYKTSGEGTDSIKGICTNCFFATTPSWLAANLPEEAIGGGFTSRFVIVSGSEKYKWLALPPVPDLQLYNDLAIDLVRIKSLKGQFEWEPDALAYYKSWYEGQKDVLEKNRDQKMRGFISRMHTIAIKIAFCLRVAYSDELILTKSDFRAAVTLVEDILATGSNALGGQGLSRTSITTNKILRQIQILSKAGPVSFTELLRCNVADTNKAELFEVMETIIAMEVVKVESDANGKPTYRWIGITEKGKGGQRNKTRGRHERKD